MSADKEQKPASENIDAENTDKTNNTENPENVENIDEKAHRELVDKTAKEILEKYGEAFKKLADS